MKKTIAVLAAMTALAAVTVMGAPSFAARQKGGAGGASNIWLDTVTNGDGTTVRVAADSIQPALGNRVTFGTTVEPLAGWEYPLIDLECRKAGAIVFLQLDSPNATFLLGGGGSDWLTSGGPATCTANLDAYGRKGGSWSVRVLKSTTFEATG